MFDVIIKKKYCREIYTTCKTQQEAEQIAKALLLHKNEEVYIENSLPIIYEDPTNQPNVVVWGAKKYL
jgi:effector-binding domain-containing protein